MISSLLTSSISPSQQCTVRGEWAYKGLGLQVGVWTISSNWNDEDVTETKILSGMKLSGADGGWDGIPYRNFLGETSKNSRGLPEGSRNAFPLL